MKDDSRDLKGQITRREMLKVGTLAIPAVAIEARALAEEQPERPAATQPRNVILFLTDQERAPQHFPPGWEARNLPGITRLKRHGLTFNCAFANACMCSPSRTTLMTGMFPAQHGVKYTLEEDMQPLSGYPAQFSMPFAPGVTDLTPQPNSTSIDADARGNPSGRSITMPNLATVAAACGFNPVYKGKGHCSKPFNADGTWVPDDIRPYGFDRWNPQDAGANQDVSEAGGAPTASTSTQNNDARFMFAHGDVEAGEEGALAYLRTQAIAQQPFFLVISLVNPHDVLAYPEAFAAFGYDENWLRGDIKRPATVNEDLSTKPSVQKQFLELFNLVSGDLTAEQQVEYLNFYGNLMKLQDDYLRIVLETLDSLGLTDDTLIIRTADHGEMGTAHGGLRQKNFNFYEESIRVPLVYSNPKLFPRPRTSEELVSHVDFLPTLAGLYHYRKTAAGEQSPLACAGVDYSSIVLGRNWGRVQDYIVFTYDDYQSGQASNRFPPPPNHIVSLRKSRWKLAEYYDPRGVVPSQFEMYDLLTDPLEKNNLVHSLDRPELARQFLSLQRELEQIKSTRLQPLKGGYYLTSFS